MIETNSQERSLILKAISQISIRTLKPLNQALTISLQNKNPQVRKNAIRDFTKIYELMSQINKRLYFATEDPDKEVQELAKWSLESLNQNRVAVPNKFDDLSMYEERNNFRNNSNGDFY